ncbi:hypothetical protein ACWDR1_16705 [Streptosporangium sandarakinum]|uniref:hypothetical protein n=1 Tax=Streptosporangium sandarakinum TaxID=1260955 RepID=UPI0033A568FA
MIALTACHHDGHERQRAVGHPVMRADPWLHPILVIRSADWVPAVHDAARNVLDDVLRRADTAALLAIVPAALAVAGRRRGDHALHAATEALRHAPGDVAQAVRRSAGPSTRRLAYRIGVETG